MTAVTFWYAKEFSEWGRETEFSTERTSELLCNSALTQQRAQGLADLGYSYWPIVPQGKDITLLGPNK